MGRKNKKTTRQVICRVNWLENGLESFLQVFSRLSRRDDGRMDESSRVE